MPWTVLLAAALLWLLGPYKRSALPEVCTRSLATATWVDACKPLHHPSTRNSAARSWLTRPTLRQQQPSGRMTGTGIRRVIKRANDCRRFKARISYCGELFRGWQKQGPNTRTIERTLEASLSPALGQALRFFPAGRTDSGVSAVGECECNV